MDPALTPANPAERAPAQALREVALLRNLGDAQVDQLVAAGQRSSVPAGQVVVEEGDPADRLYVVLSGGCRVYRSDLDGDEVEIAAIGPGDAFGELALLDGGVRSASVATVEQCELFSLDRGSFLSLLSGSPELMQTMFSSLTGRVRETTERYVHQELAGRALKAEMELARHRALSRMVAGVAHELNTPLGVANTASSIIKHNLSPEAIPRLAADAAARTTLEDTVSAVDLIERNLARAHKLVQEFKKVSAGQVTDVKEPFDLGDAVREILDLFGIGVRGSQLQVQIHDLLPAGDRIWLGYRGHLTQVLLNLLANAERYAYPDSSGGPVDITIEAGTTGFVLVVRDAGAGIPPDDLPRVFDPFFTTGRSKGGTGLGLAIVHELVNVALHGAIAVASERGRFTEFTVSLPREVPDEQRKE